MDRWLEKVALVTGANSDIGRCIVEELAQKGMKVVGLDKRIEKIKVLADELKVKTGKVFPIQCDLTKQDEIVRSMEWIEKNLGCVNVLINNACFDVHCGFLEGSIEDWNKIFETNVLGLTSITKECLKLKRRGDEICYIFNMNDTRSLRILNRDLTALTCQRTTSCAYDTSKLALRTITDCLRLELNRAQCNIKVTSIYLGTVETDTTMSMLKEKPCVILKPRDVVDSLVFALTTPNNVLIQDMVITSPCETC